MDFLSQLKKTTLSLLRHNIASNFSYVYRHFGQRDLRHLFFNYFSKYYCLIFSSEYQGFFDQYDPHAGGLGRLMCFPLVILMNRLNETVCCLMLNFVGSLFF